jgi:hypothetical protein
MDEGFGSRGLRLTPPHHLLVVWRAHVLSGSAVTGHVMGLTPDAVRRRALGRESTYRLT